MRNRCMYEAAVFQFLYVDFCTFRMAMTAGVAAAVVAEAAAGAEDMTVEAAAVAAALLSAQRTGWCPSPGMRGRNRNSSVVATDPVASTLTATKTSPWRPLVRTFHQALKM